MFTLLHIFKIDYVSFSTGIQKYLKQHFDITRPYLDKCVHYLYQSLLFCIMNPHPSDSRMNAGRALLYIMERVR